MDKIRMAALVAALLSTAGGTLGQGNTLEDLFYAIHQREAEGRVGVIDGYNDGGAALGPMQIHKAYWIDSEVAGKYQDCVNLEYSKRVMLKYWERHCPKALESLDFQTLARIHNGGPTGHKRNSTVKYWTGNKMLNGKWKKGIRCYLKERGNK